MKVKTYGVPDLTEWHGKVKAGTLEVSVSFTGGTASPSGAQPAYFMTKDPIVQFIIENSKEFKNGFIILVMSQEIAGEHPRMAVPKPKLSHVWVEGDNDDNNEPAEEPKEKSSETVADESEPAEEPKENAAAVEEPVPGIPEAITVADKYDAIEYLKEHFPDKNYTSSGLRTKTAFEAACKECGVVFVYKA